VLPATESVLPAAEACCMAPRRCSQVLGPDS